MADSTTPGFIRPLDGIGEPVIDDDALLDVLQPILVGLSGLPGKLVRPRWQPDDTPNLPEFNVDWLGFGISRTRTSTFVYEGHVANDYDGHDVLERSEEHDLLLSFYGPNSRRNAMLAFDCMQIEQNHQFFTDIKMGYVGISDPVQLPTLLNGKWARRCDITITLRRYVTRIIGIRTIVGLPDPGNEDGPIGLNNEQYIEPIFESPAN